MLERRKQDIVELSTWGGSKVIVMNIGKSPMEKFLTCDGWSTKRIDTRIDVCSLVGEVCPPRAYTTLGKGVTQRR